MAKKSVEELDAELADLEAELAALETGEAEPAPKKEKKRKKKREAEEATEEPEEAPEAAPKKKRGLPFGKKKASAEEPAEEAAEPPVEEATEPEAPKKSRIPKFGRRKKEAEPEDAPAEPEPLPEEPGPEPEPEPEPEARPAPPPRPGLPWKSAGAGAWRVSAQGPRRVEVVRRQVDAEGRVVGEEHIGEEIEAPPEPEPEVRSRFGRFGRRKKAEEPEPEEAMAADSPPEDESPWPPDGPEGDAPPSRPPRKRRGILVALLLILLAVVVVVVALPYAGVDLPGTGGGSPPVAAFTLDQNTVPVGGSVTFDAAGSRDPQGRTIEYSWDFGDGSGGQGARTNHTYQSRGSYDVVLTLRTSDGREARQVQTVTVVPPPVARIAVTLGGSAATGDNSPINGSELSFDGSGSTADGGIATYEWTFGDGARQNGAQVTHAYATAGSYRVTLRVADARGLTATATESVFVGESTAIAAEMPATLQGAQAVNHTFTVMGGGGELPYAPMQFRAVLVFASSGAGGPGGPLPIPLPGGIDPDELSLTIFDAAGNVVAASSGTGSPKEVTVSDFGTAALGAWNVQVSRPTGGASAEPYTLQLRLLHGPGA